MGAQGGFGITLYIGDGSLSSTPTYTEVAKVKDVGDVKDTLNMVETTAHDSTGGYYEAIPSGYKRLEPMDVTLIFDPAQATHTNASGGIEHAHLNGTLLAYRLVWADDSTYFECDAYVESFTWQSKQKDHWTAMATMHWTGSPTFGTL